MMPDDAPPAFDGLPDLPAIQELRQRRQWVAWSWRAVDGRPTKPPINPHTGLGASHSKPGDWGTYEEAEARAIRAHLAGVGYVMTADDGFTGADLDKCRDPQTGKLDDWAAEIVAFAETYTEVSPSGCGLRMIWRGKVDRSAKADPVHVEVYRDKRYLTITGNHVAGTPDAIRPAPRTAAVLAARLAAFQAERERADGEPVAPVAGRPVTQALPRGGSSPFFRNVNTAALGALGAWVPDLFGSAAKHQASTGAYRISSRSLGRDLQEDLSIAPNGIVDFGVHDMGDPRAGKRSAVTIAMEFGNHATAKEAAFWLCDRIGKSPVSLGWEEPGMGGDLAQGSAIAAALVARRVLVEADDGTLADPQTGEVDEDDEPSGPSPLADALTHPPGLLGDLVDWMSSCTDEPSRILNLGASISLLGTLFGRRFFTEKESCTNTYIVTLAGSNVGKSHPMKCARRLLDTAQLSHMRGGDRIKSGAGLRARLEAAGQVLYLLDEFGGHLRPWLSGGVRQPHAAEIRDMVLTMFSSAADIYNGDDLGAGSTEPIIRPHLVLYGTTTPEDFWRSLDSGASIEGFLPRFLLLDAGNRKAKPLDDYAPITPPRDLVQKLQSASGMKGAPGNLAGRMRYGLIPGAPPVFVPMSPDARAMWMQARLDLAEERERGAHEATAFIGRIGEHATKLALIRALGRNWERPEITVADFEWGMAIARHSVGTLLSRIGDHIADNPHQADYKRVRRIIRECRAGLTKRDLQRRLSGLIRAPMLEELLKHMEDAGDIEKVTILSGRTNQKKLVFKAVKGVGKGVG